MIVIKYKRKDHVFLIDVVDVLVMTNKITETKKINLFVLLTSCILVNVSDDLYTENCFFTLLSKGSKI